MEHDERDRATDGQADATRQAIGYSPTLDQMRAIVEALRHMQEVSDDWRRNSDLPAYPQHFVTRQATVAAFRVERALNPKCLPWESAQRARLNVHIWGFQEH